MQNHILHSLNWLAHFVLVLKRQAVDVRHSLPHCIRVYTWYLIRNQKGKTILKRDAVKCIDFVCLVHFMLQQL